MKAYRILRDLNLSYNMLNFKKHCVVEFQASENFIKNVGMLLKKSMILNHVNFSGMEINKQNLMSLCKEMQNAKFLLAAHLNDNGITKDVDLMYELLDIFGLDIRDVPNIRKDEEEKIQMKQLT